MYRRRSWRGNNVQKRQDVPELSENRAAGTTDQRAGVHSESRAGSPYASPGLSMVAIAGGFVFGVGATINDACSFDDVGGSNGSMNNPGDKKGP
jgi:hypothetical protein